MKRRRQESIGNPDAVVFRGTGGDVVPIERGATPSRGRGSGFSSGASHRSSFVGDPSGGSGGSRGGWQGSSRGGWQGSNRGGWQGSSRGSWQGSSRGGWQGSSRGGFAARSGGQFEPCWICGSEDHRRRDCPNKLEGADGHLIQRKLVCLKCRRLGHRASECTSSSSGGGAADVLGKATDSLCFNCGANGHSCFTCPEPKVGGGMSFATCFLCGKTGHLAKSCDKNERGVYPRGGSCKVCGSVKHLAKDCDQQVEVGVELKVAEATEESDGPSASEIANAAPAGSRGDDLDGSFAPLITDPDATGADSGDTAEAGAAKTRKSKKAGGSKKHGGRY